MAADREESCAPGGERHAGVWGRLAAFVCIVLACFGVAGDGPPRVSFVRPPAFLTAGFVTELRVRVPNHPDNRRLELDAIDQAIGESVLHTERQLDAGAQQMHLFKLLLPSGNLLMRAVLWGVVVNDKGERETRLIATASTPVQVMSKLGE